MSLGLQRGEIQMARPVGWSGGASEEGTPPSPSIATGTDLAWGGVIRLITEMVDAVG